MTEVMLTEVRRDAAGSWTEQWTTEPPEVGQSYVVLRDEWSEDFSIRTIHEWEAR